MTAELITNDLSAELWREYDLGSRVYRIDNPQTLTVRVGGNTHRVVDSVGVVHLLPGPGYRGAVIRWKPRNPDAPVQF